MNVPFYIAKKQGFQQRNAYTASIVRIGIIATALSVAVMIIAFSFINGFKHTVKEKVTQFWGDFTIADFGLKPQANLVADAIYKDARIEQALHENKNVDAYFPYILRPAILHANQLMEGIQLKGVDASFHWPTTMQYNGEALSEIDSSTANAIVAADATGKIDISFMPTGVGAEVVVCVTSENLTAGDFVNLYLNGGVITARKADATTNAKPAHGFVTANVTSPANATVYMESNTNTAVTGLTIGSDYWLSTTPGGVTTTAPSAAGNIVQYIGRATLTTAIPFINGDTIEVA